MVHERSHGGFVKIKFGDSLVFIDSELWIKRGLHADHLYNFCRACSSLTRASAQFTSHGEYT
jgi:hypothetical protein